MLRAHPSLSFPLRVFHIPTVHAFPRSALTPGSPGQASLRSIYPGSPCPSPPTDTQSIRTKDA